jgi:hypothetical protein
MIYSILFPSISSVQSSTNERTSAPDTGPFSRNTKVPPPVPPSFPHGHRGR